jgi:hypothetical protein
MSLGKVGVDCGVREGGGCEMGVRESGSPAPFNIFFRRGPFRLPAALLWLGGLIVGLAMPAIGYTLRVNGVSSAAPLLVALCGFGLVSACAWVANDLRGGQRLLYGVVIATLATSVWLAVDDFNRRYERQSAERRLVADLDALCSRAGGQRLADPECAEFSRVLDNYHYPDGVPAEVRELRAQMSNGEADPSE